MSADARTNGERLVARLLAFVRTLRAAGMRLGPGDSISALTAASQVGVADREDLRRALCATLVRSPRDLPVFNGAFSLFFGRSDAAQGQWLSEVAGNPLQASDSVAEPAIRRLAEAIDPAGQDAADGETDGPPAVDRSDTASALEVLREKDFEQMSLAEQGAARALLRDAALFLDTRPTRRFETHPRGRRPDLRATVRRSLREGGEFMKLERSRRQRREPPLVILCDISGSMSLYTRMFLHFAHALTGRHRRVYTFLFGTRLSAVTRRLQDRDPDTALGLVAEDIEDWDGGTRIAESLRAFNREWGRRVLGQGAVVLLLTDGLERDAGPALGFEMERLAMSSRRLIWLNPLLRYDRFEPLAGGMRMILPFADDLVPAHNISSLGALAECLSLSLGERRYAA